MSELEEYYNNLTSQDTHIVPFEQLNQDVKEGLSKSLSFAYWRLGRAVFNVYSEVTYKEVALITLAPCFFYMPIHIAHAYLPKWWDIGIGFSVAMFLIYRLGLWYLNSIEKTSYEYGTLNSLKARRDVKTGAIQFLMWKAGEMGHESDCWMNADKSHWDNFKIES